MFIDDGPNGRSPPAVLLRESYREGGRVKKRTLANLMAAAVADRRAARAAQGRQGVGPPGEGVRDRARPAAWPCRCGARHDAQDRARTVRLLGRTRRRASCDWAGDDRQTADRAGLQARAPCARWRRRRRPPASAGCSASVSSSEREVYAALDWLLEQQQRIESGLARRHLAGRHAGALRRSRRATWRAAAARWRSTATAAITAATGRRSSTGCCAHRTACRSPSRCSRATPPTRRRSREQIDKLKRRFGLRPRGAGRRPRHDHRRRASARSWRRPASTGSPACAHRQIQALAAEGGPLQLSLFDERDMAEITAPDFPGERLVVCRNRELAARAGAQARGAAGRHRARR